MRIILAEKVEEVVGKWLVEKCECENCREVRGLLSSVVEITEKDMWREVFKGYEEGTRLGANEKTLAPLHVQEIVSAILKLLEGGGSGK